MTLAGFLGRHIALIATTQISDGPIRLAAGIATGLLVGMAVGLVMHHTWGRLAGLRIDPLVNNKRVLSSKHPLSMLPDGTI